MSKVLFRMSCPSRCELWFSASVVPFFCCAIAFQCRTHYICLFGCVFMSYYFVPFSDENHHQKQEVKNIKSSFYKSKTYCCKGNRCGAGGEKCFLEFCYRNRSINWSRVASRPTGIVLQLFGTFTANSAKLLIRNWLSLAWPTSFNSRVKLNLCKFKLNYVNKINIFWDGTRRVLNREVVARRKSVELNEKWW